MKNLSILILTLIISLSACEKGGSGGGGFSKITKKGGGSSSEPVAGLADDTVLIEYEGGKITAKDVAKYMAPRLEKLNEEAIEGYQNSAERVLTDKLLAAEAKKQGLPNANALIQKVSSEIKITPQQIKDFRKANNLENGYKDKRTGKTRKISDDEIRFFLMQQEKQNIERSFVQDLMTKAKYKVVLEKPRLQLEIPKGAPVLGDPKAKVVIHEFSDFQCPFCSRAHGTVKKLAEAYGDKIAIVYRHYPLDFHQEAKPAAIASDCAHKQGKFWPYHDILFENYRTLSAENYKKWAKDLKLNMADFEKCLKDPTLGPKIDQDMAYAGSKGVNSTPMFFVNGVKIPGAQPFSAFKKLIDAELKKN